LSSSTLSASSIAPANAGEGVPDSEALLEELDYLHFAVRNAAKHEWVGNAYFVRLLACRNNVSPADAQSLQFVRDRFETFNIAAATELITKALADAAAQAAEAAALAEAAVEADAAAAAVLEAAEAEAAAAAAAEEFDKQGAFGTAVYTADDLTALVVSAPAAQSTSGDGGDDVVDGEAGQDADLDLEEAHI